MMVKSNVTKDGWDSQRTKPSHSRLWRDLLSVKACFDSMVRYKVGTETVSDFGWIPGWGDLP